MAPSLVGLRERSSAAWWARMEGNGTKKSPYTTRHVRSLFERLDLPRNLTWSSLIDGFHAAPTSNVFLVSVAGGHVRTIAPRSSRLDCTKVRARPSSHWRCGFDAWQRYKRFEYYLYRATQQPPPLPDALLLVDMDEVADQRLRDRRGRALPKFGTGRSPCGGTLPVPFPVKGFGALDAIEKLRHAGDGWRHELVPWVRRERRALWRGCSRRFSADSCVPHGANWSRHPRSRLVAMAAREPALLDASFTAHDQHVPPALKARLSGGRPLAAPVGFAAMSGWRYLIAIDGHGWQASLAAKLMLGSTVLSARSRYPLWFEPLLRHQVHVWRVAPSLADLPAAVRTLRADDAAARRIARQGERRIATLLHEPHLVGYVRLLLEQHGARVVADAGAPSALRLYHRLCRERTRYFCTHSWPSSPPEFDARS